MKPYFCGLENSQDIEVIEAPNMMDAAEAMSVKKGYTAGSRVAVESEAGAKAVYTLE